MNSQPPFTVRIRTEQEQDMDWMVQPGEITFHQALEVISQVLPQASITAFEYEDEEGDRITVRSDEEMSTMFQMYFSLLSEEDMVRGLLPPLIIYPRVGKTAKNRNIHGLKIKTDKQSTSKPAKLVTGVKPTVGQNTNTVSNQQQNQYQPQQQQQQQVQQTGYQQPPNNYQPPGGASLRQILSNMVIGDSDLQVLDLLGKGNGGLVHRAYHKPTGTIMAVKVMKLDVDVDVQRQIISELEILSKCNSPAIIDFYKAFFVENRISICTEYMDGGSLDRYGQVPEPVLGRMAVYIIQGLCYMWSLKILHRDIKPSNILVNTSGQVKLCDFGVSVQLIESITRTYVGTNAYMAPERIRGEEYSSPAEVWSLGFTLFELATGEIPYGNPKSFATPVHLLNVIVSEEPPGLPAANFSPDFVHFVENCMRKSPAHRLTSELLKAHPFIQRHDDGNISIIAAFIQSKLLQIQQGKVS
ncbi:dual specificity mitogen-activated protein kinase kinase 5-like isoform X1 [Ylistrum balloti]|uniref:dual specificity mitogen-activated protein kinase kinase 5-like isoform X1 n=1 Tax=Ylistrum balloti TaxID=509963 RepID=UPI002905E8D9|nr:dual specificity mitogen-activated protein kinase kinase 5-like isoform X1 [Ylistrum balloti]XP_060063677.1 dual specificity mitogen-activated protein kinase kinase 5-like isoform X1 [Ylistrum balloti]